MLIYEVNITPQENIYKEYVEWLQDHVQHMLKIKGFKAAKIFSHEKSLVVHYEVLSLKHLEEYFQNQANEMRQEAITKFKDQFSITRRVLLSL